MEGTSRKSLEMSSSTVLQATIWNDGGTVTLTRESSSTKVVSLLASSSTSAEIQTNLRGQLRSSGPENQLALVAVPVQLDSGSTTPPWGSQVAG